MSSESYLAGPPGDCCFTSVKHSGEPSGTVEDIASVPTYVSPPAEVQPDAPKRILLFFADIWGPMYINSKLLQDYFASLGFTVLGPDYFLGDPVYPHLDEEGFDKAAWMEKSKHQAAECIPGWWDTVRKTYGSDSKYCAVGYCFGAPFTIDMAATDDIVAAAIAHPAFLKETQFEAITKPLLLSCSETDHTFPLDARRRAEDILFTKKAQYHIQVFSGVAHGFAVRGDPQQGDTRWAKEESARAIGAWFIRFCSHNRHTTYLP